MKNKMKTKFLIAILAIGLFSATPMLAQEKENTKMEHQQMEKTTYTCPMHADVKSDKPGECSKCGMDLKVVDSKMKANQHCDMPKKGSCCPKKSDEAKNTTTKSECKRTKVKQIKK